MPYHLEKGHYLLLLEATLNEGIEAVVDDDTVTAFPGLDRRYSMLEHMRDVVARPCDLTHGESETGGLLAWPEFMDDDAVGFNISRIIATNWFGYRIRNDGTLDTKPHPNKPTGMWDGYQGNVERIIANTLVRAIEVSLGLDHDAAIPTGAPPRSWPIYFFFKCQQPFFEGWVTWQCHSVNRRAAGQVTVMFATPGHNHPVSDHPIPIDTDGDHKDDFVPTLRNDGEFLEEPVDGVRAGSCRQAAPRGVGGDASRSQEAQRVRHVGAFVLPGMGAATAADHRPRELLRRRHGATRCTQRWGRRLQAGVCGAMSTKNSSFDLGVAQAAVQLDTAGVLGKFLDGKFSPDESIGQSQWRSDTSEFFAIRWRFQGQHTGPHRRVRPHLHPGHRQRGFGFRVDIGGEHGSRPEGAT